MKLITKNFQELTNNELYEILKSRAEIFIIEQNINYQDMDDIDYVSIHCFYMDNNKITAYLRAFYEDKENNVLRIGRVLTIKHGIGLGKTLFKDSLEYLIETYKPSKIIMDAQIHAISFYEQFNFKVTSSEFLEEGIMHVKMEYTNE